MTPDYSYKLYYTVSDIEHIWNQIAPNDEYWKSTYHLALEQSLPKDLKPFYVIIYHKQQAVGILYLQWKKINLKDSIRLKGSKIGNIVKNFFLNFMRNNTLVVGNLLLTGKYGFHFADGSVLKHQFDVVHDIVGRIVKAPETKIGFGTILIKDFFDDQCYPEDSFNGYNKFTVQPNMMLETKTNWNTIEDYNNDLKSKARIRYKRTLNKLHPLRSHEMNLDEVEKNKSTMLNLYLNIANNASFNLFYLNADYFYHLKKHLGGKIKIIGYYNESDTLVGFYTIVKNFDHLDAHFLGYDPATNKENLLYLNMLFDMVAQGIELNVRKICMSRTAIEIKSSVGAIPVNMHCYLKHNNKYLNKLVPGFINYFYRNEEWTERNPFK